MSKVLSYSVSGAESHPQPRARAEPGGASSSLGDRMVVSGGRGADLLAWSAQPAVRKVVNLCRDWPSPCDLPVPATQVNIYRYQGG